MPFGLNIAPRIFTKLCRPILRELRTKGVKVLVYLDDWLIWGESKEECLAATRIVVQVLEKRGFLINKEKSRLIPSQSFQWLGVTWDTISGKISLPQDKVETFLQDLRLFLDAANVSR